MQSMNILDMRTLLMSNVVCSLICVVVLAVLWRHAAEVDALIAEELMVAIDGPMPLQ